MKNKIFSLLGLICLFACQPSFADFDVDDLVCPIDLKEEKANDARTVKGNSEINGEIIKAKNTNDACNTALKQTDKDKVWQLEVPSGIAILSRASDVFSVYPNPDATTASKRDAFNRAYTKAKANMIAFINGKKIKADDIFTESNVQVQSQDGNTLDSKIKSSENKESSAEGILKSHVIYDMGEKDKKVWVSIVSSQKTKNIWNRESDNCFTAASMKEGLKKALTEIQKGMIPLGGAKIINCKDTDGFVLMGFGSAQVIHYKNSNAQSRSDSANKEKAQMRAEAELLKAIKGDYMNFNKKVDGNSEENNTESSSFYKKWEKLEGRYSSAQNGTLPPGVISKVEKTSDGNWFIGVAIWMPATQAAAQQMK